MKRTLLVLVLLLSVILFVLVKVPDRRPAQAAAYAPVRYLAKPAPSSGEWNDVQTVLDLYGRDGWMLVGVIPYAQGSVMVFRR